MLHHPRLSVSVLNSRLRSCLFTAPLLAACSSPSASDGLFSNEDPSMGGPRNVSDRDADNKVCDLQGTFAHFVEIGVEWESDTIKPGAGVVRQWLLSRRELTPQGYVDTTITCGSGAKDIRLGSPWFSTRAFPPVLPAAEWIGVAFLESLWDTHLITPVQIPLFVEQQDPARATVNDRVFTASVPIIHGASDPGYDVWPDVAAMRPLLVDHDQDGKPGMTALPMAGKVPGADPPADFTNPRLTLSEPVARADQLFMILRTRAALEGTIVDCDPMRIEGIVTPGTLKIETRNVGCTVADTGQPCNEEQNAFIDSNQPQFSANGVSEFVSLKVPDHVTCADVRNIDFDD